MQLVNQICIHCRERITREAEGRFCPRCGSAVHLACSERALSASPSGCCRACGAPAEVRQERKQAREEQRRESAAAQGYQTVLLGVTLMIGGILGSMCCTGLTGGTQLVIAGGAIFCGALLVVAGFLQSARR
jgi:hypothetical protein